MFYFGEMLSTSIFATDWCPLLEDFTTLYNISLFVFKLSVKSVTPLQTNDENYRVMYFSTFSILIWLSQDYVNTRTSSFLFVHSTTTILMEYE